MAEMKNRNISLAYCKAMHFSLLLLKLLVDLIDLLMHR